MEIKDILVFVDEGDSNQDRVATAISLATTHGSQLTGVTLARLVPEHLKVSNTKALARFANDAAEQRLVDFEQAANQAGLTAFTRIFRGKEDSAARRLARCSRNFDLLILRQPNPKSRNYSIYEEVSQHVILLSGRPVLFIPYIGSRRILARKAMVAWDGSPSAARAVHDAIPVLVTMKEVVVLVVRKGKSKSAKGETLSEELVAHLQRHGINAKIKLLNAGTFSVPTVILNELAGEDIDMLVMGGYGTPSLKQKVFGGVTRTILESMIVQVLMSH